MSSATRRGRFISLEGLEGVGKTTNRAHIEQRLQDAGLTVMMTREPGGTPLGESLRNLVLHGTVPMRAETELMLMAASRIEHVGRVIEPALARGDWVLCDRFLDASVAYQGGGRELGQNMVEQLHQLMGMTLQPDLTLLLDMPVADGLARMAERGAPDRIEQETVAFFERARAAYLQRAKDDSSRVAVINAGQPLAAVQSGIDEALEPLLARFGLGAT
ncbi:MAG: dTMP kinase [Granulosicoccus sp.]